MISTNQFKNGMAIEVAGDLFLILEFQHVKPGKGPAFVRTKLKNLKNGAIAEKTFRSAEKFEQVKTEHKTMQYLYSNGDHYVFMDNETYEQLELSESFIAEAIDYLKEGMEVSLLMLNGAPAGIDLPNFIELEVVETVPGVKGDTVTGGTKPAKLETGKTISVPLFIGIGDIVKVDTRKDEYITRVS